MLDATTMLPDGRTLAYTEVGAPDGPVVFYFHGAPGGRLEMAGNDEAFAAAGIRVLTADRPGYGRSSPQHGRTTADWADDVDALAEHLGVERFAVMGLSSGGPYTMACAARLPDRVTAAVIAAGNTDMSWPDLVLGEIDDAFLADEINLTALMTAMAEAFRQGVIGYAHDITVQGRPWTFDLAAITAPVLVVHGADDRSVPVAHSEHTASLIPSAELRILPDCGHLSLIDRFPALAAEIVDR